MPHRSRLSGIHPRDDLPSPVAARIRAAAAADAPVLTTIAHAAKRHWGYPEAWIRTWRRDLTVTPDYLAQHPVYVADCAGRTAGFVGLELAPGPAEIGHLWVLPEWMGRGLGWSLMEYALQHCRQLGVERLRVVADPHAEGFYLKMGARREGRHPSAPPPRFLPVLRFDLVPSTERR